MPWQFRGMEFHGTKIIVFNLWLNDEREMELDFTTDEEVDVITTIGFLKGAPKLDIYGFNVYHKNRLILVSEEQSRVIISENTTLKADRQVQVTGQAAMRVTAFRNRTCSELEATAHQLALKVDKLRQELDYWKDVCKGYTTQLQSCDRNQALHCNGHYYHTSLGYYGSGL
ncbi:hypothetical protein PR202_ga16904 [Eleusine coracana subsp. coracana]|uniref:Morc S5 domain-containing protein n=1 Tax=Eleusine coracana subsp. coracana TaxID=191504 RepID=A0AAV5CMM1_ELECO|nr:hypothetical protein PR202_ga16904 [Eleusine coracana subsp. coracana]